MPLIVLTYCCLCFLLAPSLYAQYYRAPVSDAKLIDISVLAEDTTTIELMSLMESDDKPYILIPGYFTCSGTCPLMAKNINTVLKNTPEIADAFNVIFLSFKIKENAEDMLKFRKRHELNEDWTLAVVQKEEDAKLLMNPFGFQFQSASFAEFDHPNSAYVFSAKKKWVGLFSNNDNTAEHLLTALGDAELADRVDFMAQIRKVLQKPAYVVVLALPGLIIPLIYVVIYLSKIGRNRGKKKEEPDLS